MFQIFSKKIRGMIKHVKLKITVLINKCSKLLIFPSVFNVCNFTYNLIAQKGCKQQNYYFERLFLLCRINNVQNISNISFLVSI